LSAKAPKSSGHNRPQGPAQDRASQKQSQVPPAQPVDVVDGIPDRSPRRGKWILILLAVIFLAWMTFLVAVKILGSA
jgi:hypothetical protein